MPNSRLLAVITATILFFPGVKANAAFTLNELQTIERLIVSKNCGALWSHLKSNPSLTQGNDPLALELRDFAKGINGGLVDCLSTQVSRSVNAIQDNRAAY